jgi:hypothetical protein
MAQGPHVFNAFTSHYCKACREDQEGTSKQVESKVLYRVITEPYLCFLCGLCLLFVTPAPWNRMSLLLFVQGII